MDDILQQPPSDHNFNDPDDTAVGAPLPGQPAPVEELPVENNTLITPEEQIRLNTAPDLPENTAKEEAKAPDSDDKIKTSLEAQEDLEEESESYMDDEDQGY